MGETIDANRDADARRPRIPPRIAALLAVLLVVVIAGVVLARRDDDRGATPAPSATTPTNSQPVTSGSSGEPTDSSPGTSIPSVLPSVPDSVDPAGSTVPPATIEPVDEPSTQDATVSLTNFLDRISTVINPPTTSGTSPTGSTERTFPDISDIVTGVMADEVLATANEFEAMGWTQTGVPEIVGVSVVRAPTPEQPLDAIVNVCLDNSNVKILDESGTDVRASDTPERSLNIFVLRLVDGRWLVAARTFPDDPNC